MFEIKLGLKLGLICGLLAVQGYLITGVLLGKPWVLFLVINTFLAITLIKNLIKNYK